MNATPNTSEESAGFGAEGRGRRMRLFLLFGLALLLVQVHAYQVNFADSRVAEHGRGLRHDELVELSGKAPYVYRLLVPRLVEHTRPMVGALGIENERTERELAYLAWRLVFTFLALVAFERWLSHWLDPGGALAGTLLFAALLPATFLFNWYAPDSIVDVLLWTLAAIVCLRERPAPWLLAIVLVGALNRETIVFALAIVWALRCGRDPRGKLVALSAGLFAVWAAVFGGLRLAFPRERVVQASEVIDENLAHPTWFLFAASFFGVLWVAPAFSWRRLPLPLRRLCLVLLPYLVLQLVFGRVREVRLFLPLSVALVPAALLAMGLPPRETETGEAAGNADPAA